MSKWIGATIGGVVGVAMFASMVMFGDMAVLFWMLLGSGVGLGYLCSGVSDE